MKVIKHLRSSKLSIATLSATILLILGAGVAYAATSQSIVQGTTNQTIYRMGSNVDITGTVNGDIYCTAQTVNVDAVVNGDVICAAQTITVNGKVNGNVRIAGQTVTIGATVTNNASIVGQSIVMQNNSSIGKDAIMAGQTVVLNGPVGRDVDVAANTVTISGSIGRNMSAKAGDKLILSDKAKVSGNIDYTSPRTWEKSSSAHVLGTTSYHVSKSSSRDWTGWNIVWGIYWLVAITVLSLILVALFPQLFRKWSNTSLKQLGYVFLTGIIAMIVVPIIIFLSFISIVGIPLAILLLLLWLAAALMSVPVASYIVGSKVVPKLHPVLVVLIGSLIIGIIGLIPILGWIVGFLAYLLGSGAILWNLKKSYKKPNYGLKA